jgi:hypothetical protein
MFDLILLKFIDIQIKLNQFDEKFNKLFELNQNNSKLNEIIQNQNRLFLFDLIHNQSETNQNNSKLSNERIDKLNEIIQNQNQIYNERFDKLFDLDKNNSKLNNERFDKLLKIIENQSQLQVNMSKSILKLENKFDLHKYVLASNIPINELLYQGFKTAYDQLYASHGTTNEELFNIKLKCNKESIVCVGGSDGLNTLLLVSCGLCLDILTTTELNQPRLVNGAWWYFKPYWSFGFAPSSSIRQTTADTFDCDAKIGSKNCNDAKRLSWHIDGNSGWRLGSLNNNAKTIQSTYRKIILLL